MSGHAGDTFHYHRMGKARFGHRHAFLHIMHEHDKCPWCDSTDPAVHRDRVGMAGFRCNHEFHATGAGLSHD